MAIGRSGRIRCVAQYLLNLLLVHVQLSHLRRRSVTTSVKLEPLVLVPLPTVGVAQRLFSVPRAVIKTTVGELAINALMQQQVGFCGL